MKIGIIPAALGLAVMALMIMSFQKPSKEPWTEQQLMQPAKLAERIKAGKDVPVIYNIGPSGAIKGSVTIGATQEVEQLNLLKKELSGLSRDKEVVIYCGCCPFEHCPNIRPAFELLNEMKFTNARLLNMPKNLKVNWIDHGYPMQN